MSDYLVLTMTDAGRLSMLNYRESGFNIEISHLGLGSGNYNHSGATNKMAQKWADFPLTNGFVDTVNHCLVLTAMGQISQVKNVSEIGVYDLKGNLFAIVAKPAGYYFQTDVNGFFSFSVSIALDEKIEGQKINLLFAPQEQLLQALLNLHLQHKDPHPQYKKYIQELFTAHLNAVNPHNQYVTRAAVTAKINEYINQIRNLQDLFLSFFDKSMFAGFVSASSNTLVNVDGFKDSLKSTKYAILINPEGGHEAWSISRGDVSFTAAIFNRSGTSRVGFNGKLDWLVLSDATDSPVSGLNLPELVTVGTAQSTGNLSVSRPAGKTTDFTKAVILINPEAGHEAWSIARTQGGFTANIFNRSGRNRIGYSGLVSYLVLEPKDGKGATPSTYPCLLMAGVSEVGTFSITRPAGQNWDFTDPNIVLLITPEGGHEAWGTTRKTDKIDISVFNRSGTSRVGYSGKVSWAVFKKA